MNISRPAYRVETQRLVLRCWEPEDAPLLKRAIDESIDLYDSGRDIAAELADKDIADRILQHLHELEEPYKEVFTLHALGDIPLKRISQLFGKSDSWARVTYYRAKAMITAKLEEGEK